MPTTNEILAGLTAIANDGIVFAIIWHQVVAAALIWIASGWRPRRRVATVLLAIPLASVAAFALAYGNPFNGFVFVGGALALAMFAARGGSERVAAAPRWATTLGVAMIAYAWVYPHFLAADSWISYLYAAPVGLVPCPSLSLVIGFALLAGGVDRRVGGLLAVLGAVYGVIGVARLGVVLDVGLIAGAAGLGVLVLSANRRTLRTARRLASVAGQVLDYERPRMGGDR